MKTEDIAKKAKAEEVELNNDVIDEVETKEVKTKAETVSVKKADLNALFKRLEALEADKQSREDAITGKSNSPYNRTKKKMVKLHKWEGKYVLGLQEDEFGETVHTLVDNNRPGRDKTYEVVDLILDGVKEPVRVEMLKFRNSPTEWVAVSKTEVEEDIHNFGAVNVRDEVKGRFVETDDIVPVDVKFEYRTYTVELPDGREVGVDERYVNL